MKKILLMAPVVLAFVACNKNRDASGFDYQVKSGNASTLISASPQSGSGTLARPQGTGTLAWTSGYALVKELEFEAEKDSMKVEFETDLNQKIDLFSPLSSLGVVEVPAGFYEEIEFQIEVGPGSGENALQLDGTYSSSGLSTPVSFRLNVPLEIESEKENILVAGAANYTALTTLDLSLIATGATDAMFANATFTNGVIVISATSNTELFQIFYNNLRNCGGVEVED